MTQPGETNVNLLHGDDAPWKNQQHGTLNYNLPPVLFVDNGQSDSVRRYTDKTLAGRIMQREKRRQALREHNERVLHEWRVGK